MCPLGILLSQNFHWEGLKLHTWNALTVGHPHVSSWAETSPSWALSRLQELKFTAGTNTWARSLRHLIPHTSTFYIWSWQGKAQRFLHSFNYSSGGEAHAASWDQSPRHSGGQETRPPLLPPRPGRDQFAKELVNVQTSKLGMGVCRCEPQEASHSKPVLHLHCVAAGPQEIQSTAKV